MKVKYTTSPPLTSRQQKEKRKRRWHHRSLIIILALILIVVARVIIITKRSTWSSHPQGGQVNRSKRGERVIERRDRLKLLNLRLLVEAMLVAKKDVLSLSCAPTHAKHALDNLEKVRAARGGLRSGGGGGRARPGGRSYSWRRDMLGDLWSCEVLRLCHTRFCKQNHVLIVCMPMINCSTHTDQKYSQITKCHE
jgi:hypothetical protein